MSSNDSEHRKPNDIVSMPGWLGHLESASHPQVDVTPAIKVTETFVNVDTQVYVVLKSVIKDVLNDEIPEPPPPHEWITFYATAVGLVASLVAPPFVDELPVSLWRVAITAVLVWNFMNEKKKADTGKLFKRTKQTIVSAILRKLKTGDKE